MGAITNHPSFKTSAFITVMLAYLYQTSEEPGTKNRDRFGGSQFFLKKSHAKK
jgi:hypothetical protein